jgi:hypothetical protein
VCVGVGGEKPSNGRRSWREGAGPGGSREARGGAARTALEGRRRPWAAGDSSSPWRPQGHIRGEDSPHRARSRSYHRRRGADGRRFPISGRKRASPTCAVAVSRHLLNFITHVSSMIHARPLPGNGTVRAGHSRSRHKTHQPSPLADLGSPSNRLPRLPRPRLLPRRRHSGCAERSSRPSPVTAESGAAGAESWSRRAHPRSSGYRELVPPAHALQMAESGEAKTPTIHLPPRPRATSQTS